MSSNNDRDGHYTTKNTALAAYLRIEGFTLLDVEIERYPAVFVFEYDEKIHDYERAWQLGKAEGNLSSFFESYRLCIKMVKVGKL
jgi:hypothetical protein